jgi:hypothetical protein
MSRKVIRPAFERLFTFLDKLPPDALDKLDNEETKEWEARKLAIVKDFLPILERLGKAIEAARLTQAVLRLRPDTGSEQVAEMLLLDALLPFLGRKDQVLSNNDAEFLLRQVLSNRERVVEHLRSFAGIEPAPRLTCRLTISDDGCIFLDRTIVLVDMVDTTDLLILLRALIDAKGKWVSSEVLECRQRFNQGRKEMERIPIEWRKLRDKCPAKLRNLIESKQGLGCRLKSAAWRM